MDSVPYRDVSHRSHKEKDMAWASVEPPRLKKILHFNDFFEKFDNKIAQDHENVKERKNFKSSRQNRA